MSGLISIESHEFRTLAEQLVATLSSTSQRVYRDTFTRWLAWTAMQGVDPLAINYTTVQNYPQKREVSKASKQREKSARIPDVIDTVNPK